MARKKIDENEQINLPATKELTEEEKVFVNLLVWGGIDYQANEKLCYEKAFDVKANKKNAKTAKELVARSEISKMIADEQKQFDTTLKSEKYKNIAVLAQIRDEMSQSVKFDRKGRSVAPAADRTVAIKAIETMNKMIGVGEETEDKNKQKDTGITINLIAPEPKQEEDNNVINI